jgi:hypothetical protein
MADYTTSQAGAWDNVATWGGGGSPSASGDTATIGHAVTAPAGNIDIGSGYVTINAGGSLVWGSTTMGCGAVTLNGSASLNTGSGAWTVASMDGDTGNCTGTVTIGTGGLDCSAGELDLRGGGDVVINGDIETSGASGVYTSFSVGDSGASVTVADGVTIQNQSSNVERYYFFGAVTVGNGVQLGNATYKIYNIVFGLVGSKLVNGTSGSRNTFYTITGGVTLASGTATDQSLVKFTDFIGSGSISFGGANLYSYGRMEDCYLDGCSWSATDLGSLVLVRCIQGGSSTGLAVREAFVRLYDVAFGVTDTGATDTNSNADVQMGSASYAPGTVMGKSVYCGSTTQVKWNSAGNFDSGAVWIDHWGFVDRSGGSWPAMTRGAGYHATHAGYSVRSTSAKKSNDYGVRTTPSAQSDHNDWFKPRFRVAVPIQSGDDVTATVYCRRGPGTTLDAAAAELELDPEGVWFTPDGDASAFVSNNWDQLSVTGSSANGSSEEGMCEVEFRVVDYVASQYVDWADMEITAGGKSYTVSMINFMNGMAVLDEPTGTGGGGSCVILGG